MIGSIYKIIHLDSNLTYIGSTANTINDRWYNHKKDYQYWLNDKDKRSTVSIYPYFERYGIDRFKMILIKSYEVYDKTHLRIYEQLAINRTKCVNQHAAMQLIGINCMSKHHYQANKDKLNEQKKQYRAQNRDKLNDKNKQYRENNREKESERKKQYREFNRDKLNEKKKQYYIDNKQYIAQKASEKVQCECGAMIRKSDISTHRKSAKHIRLLTTQ